MKTLKQIMDHHFKDTVFDNTFVKKVDDFLIHFLSKNDYHVDFFGSNLIGVYPVRWNYSDTDIWWDEIFEVIPEYLQEDIYKVPGISRSFNVGGDALNHAFIYVLHRVHHSPHISVAEKERIKVRLMAVLNIKFLCSLLAHYFPYPADKGVAEKTFNSLSRRFDLKTTGSWGKMINMRSVNYVSPNGNYYQTYVEYNNDRNIMVMITDAQGRIRDTVKDITFKFYEILREESKLLLSSAQVNLDGTIMLKDIQRKVPGYIRYIKSIISENNGFIKEPLIKVIYNAVPSLQDDLFEKLLESFAKNYHNSKYTKYYDKMLENLIVFSFDVLANNNINESDLAGILYRLKHIYMSGRVTDEKLLKARDDFIKVIEAHDKKMKNTPLVPERCAFFLYIVLRTLTMNYFK